PHVLSSLLRSEQTAPTETSTLSLHDALPIYHEHRGAGAAHLHALRLLLPGSGPHSASRDDRRDRADVAAQAGREASVHRRAECTDRKSTRLNSSHVKISYAVFCLKKKNNKRV